VSAAEKRSLPDPPEVAATVADDDPAPIRAYLALVRAYEALSADIGQFFHDRGVTPQQFNVLRILADDAGGEGLRCSSISDRLTNRVPDITRLLDRLERAGLVERHRDPKDRRVVRAALTDTGRALVERMAAPLDEAFRALFSHLDEDELDQLTTLLKKARRAEEGTPRR
jgi:DNA-binding MarR family transcriptional regulator